MRNHLTVLFALALLPILPTAFGETRPDAQEWDLMEEDELWGDEQVSVEKVSATSVVNYPFLDMRIYDVLAISTSSYTTQRNVWDIVATSGAGTTSETHTGTFYQYLPATSAGLLTFKLWKPVASGQCTIWVYEFTKTGGTKNTCNLKICFGGKTLEFSSCTTGFAAWGSVY